MLILLDARIYGIDGFRAGEPASIYHIAPESRPDRVRPRRRPFPSLDCRRRFSHLCYASNRCTAIVDWFWGFSAGR